MAKKKGKDQSGSRFDLLTEEIWGEHQRAPHNSWDKACHKIRGIDNGKQNTGQENIAWLWIQAEEPFPVQFAGLVTQELPRNR